jgi:hypothetical protein
MEEKLTQSIIEHFIAHNIFIQSKKLDFYEWGIIYNNDTNNAKKLIANALNDLKDYEMDWYKEKVHRCIKYVVRMNGKKIITIYRKTKNKKNGIMFIHDELDN